MMVKENEKIQKQKEIDEVYMRRCLQLAKNGRQNAKPNPMVGAVIVSEDGRIIGEGYHALWRGTCRGKRLCFGET